MLKECMSLSASTVWKSTNVRVEDSSDELYPAKGTLCGKPLPAYFTTIILILIIPITIIYYEEADTRLIERMPQPCAYIRGNGKMMRMRKRSKKTMSISKRFIGFNNCLQLLTCTSMCGDCNKCLCSCLLYHSNVANSGLRPQKWNTESSLSPYYSYWTFSSVAVSQWPYNIEKGVEAKCNVLREMDAKPSQREAVWGWCKCLFL